MSAISEAEYSFLKDYLGWGESESNDDEDQDEDSEDESTTES